MRLELVVDRDLWPGQAELEKVLAWARLQLSYSMLPREIEFWIRRIARLEGKSRGPGGS